MRTHSTMLPASILVFASNLQAAGANPILAMPAGSSGGVTIPGNAMPGASTPTGAPIGGTSEPASPAARPPDAIGPNIQDGFACECVQKYTDGPDVRVWSCDEYHEQCMDHSDIGASHQSHALSTDTNLFTPYAGNGCGLARQGEWITFYEATHELNLCPTPGDLPDEDALDEDPFDRGSNDIDGQDGEVIDVGDNFPILDELDPL